MSPMLFSTKLLLLASCILSAFSIRPPVVSSSSLLSSTRSDKVSRTDEDRVCLGACMLGIGERFVVQSQKVQTKLHEISMSQSFPHFVGGLSAGLMECLVGHPLDTIRVRIMTSGSMGPSSGNVKSLWMKELTKAFSSPTGILDIYRGSGAELLSSAMAGCLLYGVNEWIKIKLNCDEQEVLQAKDEKDIYSKSLQPGLVMAAGAVGLMDGLISKPLEMIKLRQQFSASNFYTFRQAGRLIVQEGGYGALFRGWVPTALRETVGCIGFFVAYEASKVWATLEGNRRKKRRRDQSDENQKQGQGGVSGRRRRGRGRRSENINININIKMPISKEQLDLLKRNVMNPSVMVVLFAGGMAGLGYVFSSEPLELLSILMQTDVPVTQNTVKVGQKIYRYANMQDCFKQVVRDGGFKALYKGVTPTAIRALPAYGASFLGYEKTVEFIEWQRKSPEERQRYRDTGIQGNEK